MLKSKIFHILLLFLMLPVLAHGDTDREWIAILLSDSEPAYESQVDVFASNVGMPVRTFNLHGDIRADPTLKTRLLSGAPTLIFALGAKAAFTAKLWTRQRQDIPVLFAMVVNWRQYGLLEGQDNICGISSEVNPGIQFLNLSMFAPGIDKIGVIAGQGFPSAIIEQAQKAAHISGIELIERRIDSSREYRRTYRQLADKVDGFWILNDPATYTVTNLDWLKERCIKEHLVCIGQRRNLARFGIMLSVQADIANIGGQAASMAKNILQRGQNPEEIGVMEPLGTVISLNLRTADSIGIELSPHALTMVTEIIE